MFLNLITHIFIFFLIFPSIFSLFHTSQSLLYALLCFQFYFILFLPPSLSLSFFAVRHPFLTLTEYTPTLDILTGNCRPSWPVRFIVATGNWQLASISINKCGLCGPRACLGSLRADCRIRQNTELCVYTL